MQIVVMECCWWISVLVFFFNGCLLIIDHPKVFFSGFCDRLKVHFIINRPSVQAGRVYFSFSSYLKLKLKMKFVAWNDQVTEQRLIPVSHAIPSHITPHRLFHLFSLTIGKYSVVLLNRLWVGSNWSSDRSGLLLTRQFKLANEASLWELD